MCGCGGDNHNRHEDQRRDQYEAPRVAVATKPCPECGYAVEEDFILCPACGTQLKTSCPECQRAVDITWSRCPYCGTTLETAATHHDH